MTMLPKELIIGRHTKGPTPGFIEEVYLLEPQSDGESNTLALLANADRTPRHLRSLESIRTSLPHNLEKYRGPRRWLCHRNRTCHRLSIQSKIERKYGRVPMIQPGETRSFTLNFGIHRDEDSIQSILRK